MGAFDGGFSPLPGRLGGGDLESLNANQHARLCADLLAVRRTAPLAVAKITVDESESTATLDSFITQQPGTVPLPVINFNGGDPGWNISLLFPSTTSDNTPDGRVQINLHGASVTPMTSAAQLLGVEANGNLARVWATTDIDATFTVAVYGQSGDFNTEIGSYGGSLTKTDDTSENPTPYAALIYRDLQSQRGSAYTNKPDTLVHCENLAIARTLASECFRLPDKLKNNASGPAKADEGLEYWTKSLGLGHRLGESLEALRARATLHRKPGVGATYDNLVDEVSTLLGDSFVGITLQFDDDFETPPTNTYWPVINPGPVSFDIGGGAWLTERSQIIIDVTQPAGTTDGEFSQLMNVDLFLLIDELIPIWCTAQWRDENSVLVAWDTSGLTWDDGSEWDDLFDWNS